MATNGIFTRLQKRSSNLVKDASEKILGSLSGPVPKLASVLLENGRIEQLVSLEVDPLGYTDWRSFMVDYQAVSLLSKYPFDMGVDRAKVAVEKFLVSEKHCALSNERLSTCLRAGNLSFSSPLRWVYHQAQRKIDRLLGRFTWDEASSYFGFGPGASYCLPRTRSDAWYKFGSLNPTSTEGNLALSVAAISSIPLWKSVLGASSMPEIQDKIKIVPGNKVITVPKSAKTDRVIAIEPLMNMFVQKGIGSMLRRRLKRVGIDLDSQTRNQELAKYASETDSLATIDLSSASDTICTGLVELLLPPDWVDALKLCRSPGGTLPSGDYIVYQKISSMGNGYTFDLESLIFWALSASVCDYLNESSRDLSVFGDDIIVPSACCKLLFEVLEHAGFTPNAQKSFVWGPFRESCGKHFFQGHDVTPFYIRKGVEDPERTVWLANSIRLWCYRLIGYQYGCDDVLSGVYQWLVSKLPGPLRKPTHPLLSDDHQTFEGVFALGGDFDESAPTAFKTSGSTLGWQAKAFRRAYATRRLMDCDLLLLRWFYHRGEKGRFSGSGIAPEACAAEIPLQRYKLRPVKTSVLRWGTVGPWTPGFSHRS